MNHKRIIELSKGQNPKWYYKVGPRSEEVDVIALIKSNLSLRETINSLVEENVTLINQLKKEEEE